MINKHREIFGEGGELIVSFAPGRINIIGEHTDYNGGLVLPCAIDKGNYFVSWIREDSIVRFYSGCLLKTFGEPDCSIKMVDG